MPIDLSKLKFDNFATKFTQIKKIATLFAQ